MGDDNYPTDEDLDQLEAYEGTPRGFIEMAAGLWDLPDVVRVTDDTDGRGQPVKRVSMATLGWSGNESVASSISRTMFHALWWESSHRGGLTIYQVPADQWEVHYELGLLVPPPTLGWVVLQEHPDWEAPIVNGPRRLLLDPAAAGAEIDALNAHSPLGLTYRLAVVQSA